jgi:hypothetical protein
MYIYIREAEVGHSVCVCVCVHIENPQEVNKRGQREGARASEREEVDAIK